MIRLENLYYSLNKILLLAVGLWPYQQSKFTQFQFIFFFAILSASIIFQLTSLIILKCTLDLVAKVLSSVTFITLCIIKYIGFHLNIEVVKININVRRKLFGAGCKVKNLLMEFRYIFNEFKDKNEIAIVYKYSCLAKRYTILLTTLGICAIFIIIIAQIWSITDVNVTMNTSQPRHLLIITEYFVDQEKYFYMILLHMYTVIWIGTTIMLATGTMLITYLQHTCGMFRIASYRIEHAVNTNTLQNITMKNKILMTEGIIYAVEIHRQAMRLTKHFVSTFETMIVCFTGCVVICFSLNLFQFFQIISSKNNFNEFFLPITYMLTSILYMFIANYIGQNIADHNNHVFLTAYNVQWYRTPLHIQKMILFLLQRETKKFTLKVGGIFEASIEHFATLLKASISYFTVIYSTQ